MATDDFHERTSPDLEAVDIVRVLSSYTDDIALTLDSHGDELVDVAISVGHVSEHPLVVNVIGLNSSI